MKKLLSIAALSSLLIALVLAVSPAWAQNVDSRIKALEDELGRLKGEQIELKKDALAQVAAMPTFEYRPLNGLMISAADKSWGIQFGYWGRTELNSIVGGSDSRGGVSFNPLWSYNRPYINYCWNDCFYKYFFRLDFDGTEKGGTTDHINDMYFVVSLNQINPYLPELVLSDESQLIPFPTSIHSGGFNEAEFQRPRIFDAGNGTPVGHYSNKAYLGLRWSNIPVGSGDISTSIMGTKVDNASATQAGNSDRLDTEIVFQTRPFSQTKNRWIEQLRVGAGINFMSVDGRSGSSNGLSIFTQESGLTPGAGVGTAAGGSHGRMKLLSIPTGAPTAGGTGGLGDGTFVGWGPGFEWGYGPYKTRAIYGHLGYEGKKDGYKGVGAREFRVEHELFVWSPRGLLTGNAQTPGSVMFGWDFDRADAWCGKANDCAALTADTYNNIRLITTNWTLWYWLHPALKVGWQWTWYDADNTPSDVQVAVGCKSRTSAANGKDCGWSSTRLVLWGQF